MNAKEYTLSVEKSKSGFKSVKISSSIEASQYARQFYRDDISIYESVFIMLLNRANKVTGWAKISQGGTTQSVLDAKIVLKYAIDTLAEAVILVHNHPSGNLNPSEQDMRMTRNIREALKLVDIRLLDHIILTEDNHFSFLDEGRI